jgi:hypothetical protein
MEVLREGNKRGTKDFFALFALYFLCFLFAVIVFNRK